jgi:hypothetical protein
VLQYIYIFALILVFHFICFLYVSVVNRIGIIPTAGTSHISAEMTLAKMQRRQHASNPLHWRIARLESPDKNVNSADRSLVSACHFGGSIANMHKLRILCNTFRSLILKRWQDE